MTMAAGYSDKQPWQGNRARALSAVSVVTLCMIACFGARVPATAYRNRTLRVYAFGPK